jgi:hypothetical protein
MSFLAACSSGSAPPPRELDTDRPAACGAAVPYAAGFEEENCTVPSSVMSDSRLPALVSRVCIGQSWASRRLTLTPPSGTTKPVRLMVHRSGNTIIWEQESGFFAPTTSADPLGDAAPLPTFAVVTHGLSDSTGKIPFLSVNCMDGSGAHGVSRASFMSATPHSDLLSTPAPMPTTSTHANDAVARQLVAYTAYSPDGQYGTNARFNACMSDLVEDVVTALSGTPQQVQAHVRVAGGEHSARWRRAITVVGAITAEKHLSTSTAHDLPASLARRMLLDTAASNYDGDLYSGCFKAAGLAGPNR